MEDGSLTTKLDENPFSFKHFLKNQSGDTDTEKASVRDNLENNQGSDHDDIQHNIKKEIPFPDVHRDQQDLTKTKGKKLKQTSNKKQELSDLQIDNPFSFKNFVKKDAALKTTGRVLQIIDNDVHEINTSGSDVHNDEINQCEVNMDEEDKKLSKIQSTSSLHKELDDVEKLVNENKKLSKELREARKSKEEESKRVASLLKKLKEYEEKENEETAALEKMVHMVEKNLELTTQRAVKAEAMNLKLREENKLLKGNSVSKTVYDDLLNKHHGCLSSIKDQAVFAAQHLDATATKAEESLKQLYSGVDSFKLVSQLLSSIDKFTNLDQGSQT